MKSLWITLLVSVGLCGLSFVYDGNENMTSYLCQEMKQSNLETNKSALYATMKISEMVSAYPEYKEYEERWQKSKTFLSLLSKEIQAPKSKKEARRFLKEWNRVDELYFINFFGKDDARWDVIFSSSIGLNNEIYHRDKSYHAILNEYLQMRLKNLEVSTGNHFAEVIRGTGYSFCWGGISSPSKLKLSLNQTSEIPIVIDLSCYRDKYNISNLWINNQLVFTNGGFHPFRDRKVSLIYNGEKEHHVKVRFQRRIGFPVEIGERTFDFDIKECDK